MMLVLRCAPVLRQTLKLQLKLQLSCPVCRMSLPSSDDHVRAVLDVLFGDVRLTSKYQWCVCGRLLDFPAANDRNYRARWRRRQDR